MWSCWNRRYFLFQFKSLKTANISFLWHNNFTSKYILKKLKYLTKLKKCLIQPEMAKQIMRELAVAVTYCSYLYISSCQSRTLELSYEGFCSNIPKTTFVKFNGNFRTCMYPIFLQLCTDIQPLSEIFKHLHLLLNFY